MDSLLQRQQELLEAIEKIETNFNKDSATRKTRKYLDDRLDKLDKLWAEIQLTDDKISAYKNDTDPYFTENQYHKAKNYFDFVRSKIASFVPVRTESSISPTPEAEPTLTVPKRQERLFLPSTSRTKITLPTCEGQAAELISLQRTNFRAFLRQVNSIKVEEIRDKWELEDELRNIQSRWNAIDTLHLQVDHILQGSDTQYDEEFNAYEKSYKSIKKALNLKLASRVHIQQSTPQLDIPTFTGSYTQWPTFYDLYVESIHNNNFLTKTQKMQHLKGKLRGDAERLIQHLNISADNYDTAWDILTHRYNNPQLLFTKQIELFLNQPVAQKQSSYEIRRLYDTSMECIHAIQNLGIDTNTWDPFLVHIIATKLDTETYCSYKEARRSPRDLPSLSELMNFLESKFNALEPLHRKDREISSSTRKPYQQKPYISKTCKPQFQHISNHRYGKLPNREFQAIATCSFNCPICNNKHYLYKCNKFISFTPDERLMTVKKFNICHNCLHLHNNVSCTSAKKCKVCQNNHNTMLHDAYVNMEQQLSTSASKSTDVIAGSSSVRSTPAMKKLQISTQQDAKHHSVNHIATADEEILLTTISVNVKAIDGTYLKLRCLLDQGSQISLISEKAAQMLGLPRRRYQATVSGIGNGTKYGKGVVTLECQSIYQNYEFTTDALVINHVISNLPNVSFSKESWPHLQHMQLADPEYNVSGPIDLLLDASIYSEIIMSGLIKGPNMAPIAQQTRLGWILSGNVKTFQCHVVITDLSDISQYWELEDISDMATELKPEEQYCERLYQSTTRRLSNGRYEVALPMKPGFEQYLGQSKPKAIAQFYNLENKMSRDKKYSENYKGFMLEYEQQGHMSIVKQHSTLMCYLPHHGVRKLDSTTTQLRTVFNASSKTSSGKSLNDLMESGPNLQRDLQHLILVWRQHKYVITADIEKMFRQLRVREMDQHLQCIIWRSSQEEPLKEYQLTTVTYGTKAAPYLAMRTLRQLAVDDAHKFPLASAALMTSLYMDDLLEGSDDITKAKKLQWELIEILKGAGMNIRKWSSNTIELTKDLSADQLDKPFDFKGLENRKTLGLRWVPSSDIFVFKNVYENESSDDIITKRQLLSKIAKIYDPIGLLCPLSVRAKLLFQRTWSEKTAGWDTNLAEGITCEWRKLKHDFQNIDKLKIPRYLGDKKHYVIHGFCDASERAYACSIYAITLTDRGEYTSTLMIAKTKVAPLKNKLTLPKLELCGALLLSRLMKKVMDTMPEDIQMYAWTDSMVVLGWIRGDVNRWKTFVGNRVRTILNIIPSSSWHHVCSEDNSADCATRGLSTQQLSEHLLWWHGPEWLLTFNPDKIKNRIYESTELEIKIPLVNKDTFELDKVIGLPQQNYIVQFITSYIAFNLQRDLLLPLTESDVQNCIRTRTNKLLCSIDKPIYELQLTQSICNLSKYNKTMCIKRQTACRERWIKLHGGNRWLFTCCITCTVRIFCVETEMTIKSLTGNGILNISQGCTIKGDTFSIFGHNNYLSRVNIQESIQELPEISILNSIVNTSILEQFTPEDHGEEWRKVKTQISNLKEQESVPLSIHDVHQYSVMYSVLGLVILAGCVFLITRCRRSKTSPRIAPVVTNNATDSIPMAVVTRVDQMEATQAPPRIRPRSMRLDIPDISPE